MSTEALANALWWIIHVERVSMLSWEGPSRLSFSRNTTTEKDDMTLGWRSSACKITWISRDGLELEAWLVVEHGG